jgi:hypothetical protein
MKTLNTAAVGSYEHSFWCFSGATLITAASGASVASELSAGKRSMSLSRHDEHQSSLQASIRSKSLFRHQEQVSLQASGASLSSGIRSKSLFRHQHLMTAPSRITISPLFLDSTPFKREKPFANVEGNWEWSRPRTMPTLKSPWPPTYTHISHHKTHTSQATDTACQTQTARAVAN